jgi:hypothetical protein
MDNRYLVLYVQLWLRKEAPTYVVADVLEEHGYAPLAKRMRHLETHRGNSIEQKIGKVVRGCNRILDSIVAEQGLLLTPGQTPGCGED